MANYSDAMDKLLSYLDKKDIWLAGGGGRPWFAEEYDSIDKCLEALDPSEHDKKVKQVYDRVKSGDNKKAQQEGGNRHAMVLMAALLRTVRLINKGSGSAPRLKYADFYRDGRYSNAMIRGAALNLQQDIKELTK